MKITYVSHASFLIESNGTTVVTDPWYHGSAYCNQWHVFPKPIDTSFSSTIEHIILTHGHEDHFHPSTLERFNKDATIYIPYTWKGGQVETLKDLGFKDIREIQSSTKTMITEGFNFTFVVNGLDAFVVYEVEGKIILNLNDALNASHKYFLRMFTKVIKKNWEKIDYLICGLGGAGYFPNMVHSSMKNDYEIGHLREQFLAYKFCEIVDNLEPDFVIPFVPGFALLEEDNQWINEVRFPRNKLKAYFEENFKQTSVKDFYYVLPGDDIVDEKWNRISPYHKVVTNDNLVGLLSEQYGEEIHKINQIQRRKPEVLVDLKDELNKILNIRKSGIGAETLKKINFIITLEDVDSKDVIHCFHTENKLIAEIVSEHPEGVLLNIRTHSWKLEYAIHNLWGGDIFYIGYGAHVDVIDHSCLEDNMDIVCIRMLSRFPSALENISKEPARALTYFIHNTKYAKLAINQKIKTFNNLNKLPFNERDHWIRKNKCEICRLCDIPLMSDEFGEFMLQSEFA